MLKFCFCCLSLILASALPFSVLGEDSAEKSVYQFTMQSIEGESIPLIRYRGKILLIVNVASKCGFTGQYEGLQKLYDKYSSQGLEILGFPANNFAGQEPGSNADIQSFCKQNYGVTFPMFEKISVKGKDQNALYAFLTDKKIHPGYGGSIGWNFTKFLVNRDGVVIGRFSSLTKPLESDFIKTIESALAAPVQ